MIYDVFKLISPESDNYLPSFAMEPTGLTVSILALAGLFNNAVDCFEYVQIGRSFGVNFQTSVLKLDNVRLRLSRWGQSVGLSGDLNDVQSLHQTLGSAEHVEQADRLLGLILQLFADAEGISTKFRDRNKSKNTSLEVNNTKTDLEPMPAILHQKMRELSVKRQNRAGLRQKAKWALYEEKHFRRLIEDVTDLVDDLVDLFPAAQASQQELCKIEVSELSTDENLPVLKDIAANLDRDLEAAVTKAIQNREHHSSSVIFSGSQNSGFQLGHNTGTISGLRWGGST